MEANMTRTSKLVTLAQYMQLSQADAVALPTVITVSAGKVGMTEDDMLNEAVINKPLRDYLVELCKTTMAAQ
jgi:hypothetical protein